MRRTLYVILISFFIAGCSGGQKVTPLAGIGEPAPDFTVELLSGKKVSFDNFRGKPLVLTFMAEWCPCSNESAPVFKEAYRIYHPRGVEFLLLGFQDSLSRFRKFVEKEKFPFPAGYDRGDRIGTTYGVNAPPTTFFITADGIVRNAYYGKIVELEKLSSWIDEIVEEKEPRAEEKRS